MTPTLEIIAHRGYSARAPENTLAALEAAIEAGADAVEFDVHVSACGTPLLFHDATLNRTTDGRGPVSRRTLEQLRTLDAGAWFDERFRGERIPTLSEALQLCRGRVARVYLEVKGYRELEDLDRMLEVTREARMLPETVFISMRWPALDHLRGGHPELAVGYIVAKSNEIDEALERARRDAAALVDFKAALLLEDPSLAGRCAEAGVETAVWTVDEEADAERISRHGVRRITTNQVGRLVAWKASRTPDGEVG